MDENKLVVFTLNNENYGVDISRVQGIEREQNIVRIPNTASYIKGIINLRGNIIPVYDLREKFNMPQDNTQENQYIVVMVKGCLIALEVGGVKEIQGLEQGKVFEIPRIIHNEQTSYFEQVLTLPDCLIVVVNVDNLMTEEELEKIDEMIKQY